MTSKSSSKPSLLNRLRSKTSTLSLTGLRPSRRTLGDFHIRLNDPHRVYSPTDTVKGSVCLTVEKALNFTHLVVNLVGRVDLNLPSTKDSGKKRKEWDAEYDDGSGGGIVLCRDESVLCGEGRLEPGKYEFKFELFFVPVGKMVGGLPSSLDFEKGSISYTISSTLTRPTTLSPTTTCTTNINLLETIDIGRLPKPKPHIIQLEPIVSRRSRKRPSSPATTPSVASSPNSSLGNLPPSSDPGYLSPTSTPAYIKSKTITTSIEMANGGALRGDNIPIKISVRHTKAIKSLNGSGTFRKDLSQTVMPLIIDPKTLTAVVRANLRVPEDVFPTINSVPGGEVSFRYWVEVVVDLGGKLSGRDDIFIGGGTTIPGLSRPKSAGEGGVRIASEGGVMIETERIRKREKSVIFCKVPVVIGSVDSVTGRGRRAGIRQISIPQVPQVAEEMNNVVEVELAPPASPTIQFPQEESEVHGEGQGNWNEQAPDYTRHPEESHYQDMPLPPHEPERENAEPHEEMDEKTRIRFAEQSLLPSAPPGLEAGESSASAPPLTPAEMPDYMYYPSAPPMEPSDQHHQDVQEGVDDKQEAERLRLLASAGSPDDNAGEGSSNAPSAPVLDEHDLEGGLPRYQR
ncbi:uncharacterized protein H6S33_005240 [Morchella sextelata]|uniref:uncharacterized protein n=1 Tax=Morchella sextelata TaxID=1174677 RepID=UPI001D048AEE|nr:uncharacterized protein H6S33_005240 [Morchella sextelata]KAH0605258.1 hypothetical protein H6S33_005240 [Morchella sextelata]